MHGASTHVTCGALWIIYCVNMTFVQKRKVNISRQTKNAVSDLSYNLTRYLKCNSMIADVHLVSSKPRRCKTSLSYLDFSGNYLWQQESISLYILSAAQIYSNSDLFARFNAISSQCTTSPGEDLLALWGSLWVAFGKNNTVLYLYKTWY